MLYETAVWVLYFQINHFQLNDFATYFSSVFYFVLHMSCFLAVVNCKQYRVRLYSDAHFLLLVFFFLMIYDIFIWISQFGDNFGYSMTRITSISMSWMLVFSLTCVSRGNSINTLFIELPLEMHLFYLSLTGK